MLPLAIAQDLQCFVRVLHSRYGEDLFQRRPVRLLGKGGGTGRERYRSVGH